MTSNPLRRLVVLNAGDDALSGDDHRHVALSVQPEITRIIDDDERPLMPGLDPTVDADWHDAVLDAADVAGTLGRLAVKITPTLLLTGMRHGCEWEPLPSGRTAQNGEIEEASTLGNHCGTWLDDEHILDAGYMPYLHVYVPRNRERAWTAHLRGQLDKLARATADALAP